MTIVLLVALFVAQPAAPTVFVGKTIVAAEIFVEGVDEDDNDEEDSTSITRMGPTQQLINQSLSDDRNRSESSPEVAPALRGFSDMR